MLDSLAERERLTSLAYAGGWVALTIAAAACLWVGSRLFWDLLPGEQAAASLSAPSSTAPVTTTSAPQTDLRNLHLFGQAGAMTAPAIIDAPETTLDLRLLGTLAQDDPGSGLAIIVDSEGRESYYGVDDDLPGSARLHEIHPDRVILVRQGRYETLSLRQEDGGALARPRRGAPGTQRNTTPAASPLNRLQTLQSGTNLPTSQQQQSFRMDPAELAKKIQLLPYSENGKPVGVRLQAGRDAALMRLMSQAGLRTTDIITQVNGIPLNDPSRTFEAISALQSQTQFTVVVRRAGREQTLNINLNR